MVSKWIDIIETNPTDPEYPRTSSLEYSNCEELLVTGNLPHGYKFAPKTERDRDTFVAWLNAFAFEGGEEFNLSHVLMLVGYHVAIIMDPKEKTIECSPHRDMPVFERDLNAAPSRIHVRNEYMQEVARLMARHGARSDDT